MEDTSMAARAGRWRPRPFPGNGAPPRRLGVVRRGDAGGRFPGAWLLGPMMAGIIVGVNGGSIRLAPSSRSGRRPSWAA